MWFQINSDSHQIDKTNVPRATLNTKQIYCWPYHGFRIRAKNTPTPHRIHSNINQQITKSRKHHTITIYIFITKYFSLKLPLLCFNTIPADTSVWPFSLPQTYKYTHTYTTHARTLTHKRTSTRKLARSQYGLSTQNFFSAHAIKIKSVESTAPTIRRYNMNIVHTNAKIQAAETATAQTI